jgi:hypothetical protein
MRIGAFEGPSGPYGQPTNVVHPEDNNIVPDAAKAESDAAQALADQLFADIKNAGRDPNAGKTVSTK